MISIQYRQRIEELGRSITPALLQGTIAMFAKDALKPDASFCSVTRDVAYGENSRHRLDIFRPLGETTGRPIIMFVHGGGFIGGDKGNADAPFYNNIGAWAARSGFIGVTMTYRLAPAAPWPAGADDVAAAVRWVRQHASEYGGSNRSIFVMGQSAGAAHVASYIADARYRATDDVAGAIMLSGIYDLTRLIHSPMEDAYYGTDPARFAEQSSINGLVTTTVPCLYSVAEFDPENFQQQTGYLAAAYLSMHRVLPRLLYLTSHNHLSPALEIGGHADSVGPELGAFIDRFATP
jgi:acetyl esterase/lipase